jgi:hypothetical protein
MFYDVGLSWAQCYKTSYARNFRLRNKLESFDPGNPFQPSLMFAGIA